MRVADLVRFLAWEWLQQYFAALLLMAVPEFTAGLAQSFDNYLRA